MIILPNIIGARKKFNSVPMTNMALWLDSSNSSSLFTDAGTTKVANDGDLIYQWNDLSGNGRHAIQTTSSARPTWRNAANGINGLACAYFNGSNNISTTTSGITTQPYQYYFVIRFTRTNAQDQIIYGAGNAGNIAGNSSAGWNMYACGLLSGSSRAASTLYQGTISYNGGSSTVRLNGSQVISGTLPNCSPTAYTIGGGPNGNAIMYICEIIIYSTALSSANRSAAENYLRNKWKF